MMRKALIAAAFIAVGCNAYGQNAQRVIPLAGAPLTPITSTNPLPISGSFSATLGGFAPGGTFATLTAAGTSGSVALPGGTVVVFQNTGTTAVSCTLGIGSATALVSENIVQSGTSVAFTVGANTFGACIDQTGSTSNVVVLSGGSGLFTGFGGGGGSGGGGGAVTLASGAVASGAYSSGSVASGAFASGSIASGAVASGAFASGALASGSVASGAMVDLVAEQTPIAPNTATATKALAIGGQYDSTQKTLTNGQQASLAISPRGAAFVAVGADGFAVTNAGTFAVQASAGTNLNTSALATSANQTNAGQKTQIVDGSGAVVGTLVSGAMPVNVNNAVTISGTVTANAGTNLNTSALATTANLTAGTMKSQIVDGSGNVIASTTNALNVNVNNANTNGQAVMASSSPVVLANNQSVADPCTFQAKTNIAISTTAGTTQLVAPSGSTQVYVCSIVTVGGAASVQNLVGGTGAACTTGTPVAAIGSTTAANGMSFLANGGFAYGGSFGTVARTTTAGHGLCLIQSGTAQISGNAMIVQQ